jgi:MFS family permease
MQTLVLPLLPEFMRAFHTSVSAVTWVFTATLLAGAVATPLLSRFGGMYGKKKMHVGVGGGLSMLVTGIIAEHTTSYRPVFWISAVLGAIGLILVSMLAPAGGRRAAGRPDLAGAVLLAAWLVCLLLAISEGPSWGWGTAGTIGLFAAAAAGCALWTVLELRVRAPLVRLTLLVGPRSLSANLASTLLGFGMFAAFTLFTNLVQTPKAQLGYGLSGSVLDVGLYLLPATIGMLIFSAMAGAFERKLGAAYTLAIGSLFVAASLVWLAVSNSHVYDMVGSSALQGIGFGIGYAALGTLAVQDVPMDSTAIASGVNSLVRTTGGSIGAAVVASILASDVIHGTVAPTLHAYVISYVILAAGACLAAAAAAFNGLRYREP